MKKNSLVSVIRYLIVIVVKQDSVVSVVSQEKRLSESSQIFHFNTHMHKLGPSRLTHYIFGD